MRPQSAMLCYSTDAMEFEWVMLSGIDGPAWRAMLSPRFESKEDTMGWAYHIDLGCMHSLGMKSSSWEQVF